MRPLLGGDSVPAQPGKQSSADADGHPHGSSGGGPPTTFFMASESMIDSNQTPTASVNDSSFGIRSLEEDPEAASARSSDGPEHARNLANSRRRSTIKSKVFSRDESIDSSRVCSTISSPGSSPSRPPQQNHNLEDASQPLTPISFTSPTLGSSIPSSPKSVSAQSFRHSDDGSADERNSQAIESSGDEDDGGRSPDENNSPQLIMPSILMPSRRPFTEKGKDLGKLKMLFAGGSGVGKSSLLKSIIHACEDIVHVDPLPNGVTTSKRRSRPKSASPGVRSNPTKQIMEIYASTKAYPAWWADLEGSTFMRRRKGSSEAILERNLCFVDTPGYDSGTSVLEGMENVLAYIETQMSKSFAMDSLDDSQIVSILGGSGGPQVDLVFYLVSHPLKQTDIVFLKRLSSLTNVVPLLSKADTLSKDKADHLRASISSELLKNDIITFPLVPDQSLQSPYLVCSSPSNELENMDASLLMQSDYIQPLLPSELHHVIDGITSKEVSSYLKNAAAKKLVQARGLPRPSSIALAPTSTAFSPASNRVNSAPAIGGRPSTSQALATRSSGILIYNQACIADHTKREERLARVHLANWAGNLQRSLQNERRRYEVLAQGERMEWLKARLGECVFNGEIQDLERSKKSETALVSTARNEQLRRRQKRSAVSAMPSAGLVDRTDPLGLMRWREVMGNEGVSVLKIAGVCGIIGAVTVWAFRTFNVGWALGEWELG